MAASSRALAFLSFVRVPLVLAVLWAIAGLISSDVMPDAPLLDFLFPLGRVILVGAAGFLVVKGGLGLWSAALAGAVLFFVDHLLIKGIAFLAENELAAAGGVLVSFAMLVWVAMAIGVLGGAIAKIQSGRSSAAI
jgi:hypothetical protein